MAMSKADCLGRRRQHPSEIDLILASAASGFGPRAVFLASYTFKDAFHPLQCVPATAASLPLKLNKPAFGCIWKSI